MKTELEILLDHQKAMAQANQLDEIADKLDRLSEDKMEDALGKLKSAWQSDNSPAFYSKSAIVQGDIKNSAGNVRKIARAIRETANAIKKADLAALEIAKTRDY